MGRLACNLSHMYERTLHVCVCVKCMRALISRRSGAKPKKIVAAPSLVQCGVLVGWRVPVRGFVMPLYSP